MCEGHPSAASVRILPDKGEHVETAEAACRVAAQHLATPVVVNVHRDEIIEHRVRVAMVRDRHSLLVVAREDMKSYVLGADDDFGLLVVAAEQLLKMLC